MFNFELYKKLLENCINKKNTQRYDSGVITCIVIVVIFHVLKFPVGLNVKHF